MANITWRVFNGIRRSVLILALAGLAVSSFQAPAQSIEIYTQETGKSMKQVMSDAEFAITDRNFRVVNKLHVGKAIRESGHPHFPDFNIILFCNVNYARKMLQLDPDMINFCPGRIAMRQQNNKVVITAPLFPDRTDNKALNKITSQINALIRQMVDCAAKP